MKFVDRIWKFIIKNPDLINEASTYFGSQCVVVAIDAKKIDDEFYVHINAGKKNTGIKLLDWAKDVFRRRLCASSKTVKCLSPLLFEV